MIHYSRKAFTKKNTLKMNYDIRIHSKKFVKGSVAKWMMKAKNLNCTTNHYRETFTLSKSNAHVY
jgi:hypothetical protein